MKSEGSVVKKKIQPLKHAPTQHAQGKTLCQGLYRFTMVAAVSVMG